MPEGKDNSKPKGWFPDINYLLLAALAGTLFFTQKPFHESRPRNQEPAIVHQVNARPWQDPFEAIDHYIEKTNKNEGSDNPKNPRDDIENIRGGIEKKATANGLSKLNVVAVMLPGGVYYEDSETRRKLRYAVLSGFNAALRYMPEDTTHLQFFYAKNPRDSKDFRVAYEWVIYPPTNHNQSTAIKNERSYQRPPVLVLWLNNDDFKVTPHEKIKHLVDEYLSKLSKGQANKEKIEIGHVAVLGPFNSSGLQDLVGEMASITKVDDNVKDNYHYYSPSATVWECNFLWDITPKKTGKYYNYDIYPNLQGYFKDHNLSFLRVTATDWDLALTIKEELERREIQPSKRDRILLIGEWDSLYTWHLVNTFTEVFTRKNPKNQCVREKRTGRDLEKNISLQDQYILQASYLRGLDGEKPDSASSSAKPQLRNERNIDAKNEAINNVEESNGDSQFDYIRRLATQTERLDQEIRADKSWNYPDSRAIKAIGVLGSDAYDKLLIFEAMHSKFPDAVFFTNGFDTRLTEPKNNEWARNLVIATSYGLTLNRYLQKDIPPFRDDIQTAFFLATEMALAEEFNSDKSPGKYEKKYLSFDDNIQALLRTTEQTDFDKLLMQKPNALVRLFEVGRTQSFNLNTRQDCKQPDLCLHQNPPEQNWNDSFLLTLIGFLWLALLLVKPAREFLGQRSGLWFVSSMVVVCWNFLAWIHCGLFKVQNGIFDGFLMLKLTVVAGLYAMLMYAIICFDKKLPPSEGSNTSEGTRKKFFVGLNLMIIAMGVWIIWSFVRPGGVLKSIEPYALWEGISMWPSQAIRFFTFILAGFFILQVSNFPRIFTKWLEKNVLPSSIELTSFPLLNQWWNWKEKHCNRNLVWGFTALLFLEIIVLWYSEFPNLPFRGKEMFSLNILLLQGLLLPASLILLVLVSDATIAAVMLMESCMFGEKGEDRIQWPRETLNQFSAKYGIPDGQDNLNEWVGLRFIDELTRQIYGFIGYPLIIALLLVLACSSYFDNWIMPFYMKLSIVFCVGWLLYWDQRLMRVADKARENALTTLRLRVLKFQSKEQTKPTGEQLERLISMIEIDEATVYKTFTQRPIFINTLLIIVALLVDSTDYFLLASKLLRE